MPDLNDIKTVEHVKHMSLHVILRSDPQPHAQLAYQILIQVKDQPLCRVKWSGMSFGIGNQKILKLKANIKFPD